MSNPYLIQGPAQISFSGGRSSGMMLCKIVEAHDGTLPIDVVVAFANTGKEREETLTFIGRLSTYLGIETRWVEYGRGTVSLETASRKGEPFAAMIHRGKTPYLPNPVHRLCTQHLKVQPMRMEGYATVSGIRADEPRRAAKLRDRTDSEFILPLVDAGVTKSDVMAFWQAMPFDLELPSSEYSNCDLCYLKGASTLIGLIREKPSLADWWIEQETKVGSLFRSDRPNYAALKVIALQPQLDFGVVQEDSLPCECVD